MIFINVNHSNSNPQKLGMLYLKFQYYNEHLPETITLDREIGKMATIHAFLVSRSNVRTIERWWKDLQEHLAEYFKLQS